MERGGWRFFGYYNKNDPISLSHLQADLDECNENYPVTVAYGDTLEQATLILADGRFSSDLVKPNYAVASVWQELDMLPTPPPLNTLWLDTLDVSKITQGFGMARARTAFDARPLCVGGKKYHQGIGTHAESKFAIDLKSATTRFTATVGVDEGEDSPKGSVVFEVWADDQLVGQSSLLHKGQSFDFDVDLTGAKMLGLRVTDGGDGIDSDHADWCNALLYLDPTAKENPEAISIAK